MVNAQPVAYAFSGGLARFTLEAASGNPINAAFTDSLRTAVNQAAEDSARVILVTARGKFFCVGGDLREIAAADDRVRVLGALADALHSAIGELQRSDAIVVSAVQGPCAGAGFPLAFAADVVLAAESASFTLGYTKLALSPDGGTSLLVRSLGLQQVLHLALLNDTLSAAQAHAAGLVARVVPDQELSATAEDLVQRILRGPAGALAATKHLLRETAMPDCESALRREANVLRAQGAHAASGEGVTAFLAKREPAFPA